MLRNVFEAWLGSLSEAEFSKPYISLLYSQGFFDIHVTHGSFEFGKDLIAKYRDENGIIFQFAIQTKVGDIAGSQWGSYLGQIHELCDEYLAHANFDTSLPREFRLVTTGVLKGKAITASRALKQRIEKLYNGNFEILEGHNIVELMGSLNALFPLEKLSPEVTAIVGLIYSDRVQEQDILDLLGHFSNRGFESLSDYHKCILDTTVAIAALREKGFSFYSVTVAMHCVRLSIQLSYTGLVDDDESQVLIDDACEYLFNLIEREVVARFAPFDDPMSLAQPEEAAIAVIINYQVTCIRLMELLGLALLWNSHKERAEQVDYYQSLLVRLVEMQPGCLNPISDKQATSYPPAVIALVIAGREDLAGYLMQNTTIKLCDVLEDSPFGIAGPKATVEEEIERFLGGPYEFIDYPTRTESLFATVFLDLSVSCLPVLYHGILNEFRAVDSIMCCVLAEDAPSALYSGGPGTSLAVNIQYPDTPEEAIELYHLRKGKKGRLYDKHGPYYLSLILSCLNRDIPLTDSYPVTIPSLLQDSTKG